MKGIVIHIGLPRTGTTTIQKYALEHCKNGHVFTKTPFTSAGKFSSGSGSFQPTFGEIKTFINSVSSLENESTRKDITSTLMILSFGACHADKSYREASEPLLDQLLIKMLAISQKSIYLSHERFSDCGASLNGDSMHTQDLKFSIHPLLDSMARLGETPLITVCMREPISYLRSKFVRTAKQRKILNVRTISAKEFIQKQAFLEESHPGTSALTPAVHTEFLRQLQKRAFVKAFGFQDLLASDDIFSLLGLPGEDRFAFRDFPRENKLEFAKEHEQLIEMEIIQALKQYGFYDRIMKAQMFQ